MSKGNSMLEALEMGFLHLLGTAVFAGTIALVVAAVISWFD